MRPNPIVRGSLFAGCRDAVRARPGRFSGLSVLPSNSLLNGAFVWARSVLNSQKRRFPAPADEPGHPLRPLARHRARGVRPGPARARSHYHNRIMIIIIALHMENPYIGSLYSSSSPRLRHQVRPGLGRIVASHCRSSASYQIHLRESGPLFLKRQCDRTLGLAGRVRRGCGRR